MDALSTCPFELYLSFFLNLVARDAKRWGEKEGTSR